MGLIPIGVVNGNDLVSRVGVPMANAPALVVLIAGHVALNCICGSRGGCEWAKTNNSQARSDTKRGFEDSHDEIPSLEDSLINDSCER
jgi:hypothetical protein